jgi:glycosyltransferase involved in cell wall biosynthesis
MILSTKTFTQALIEQYKEHLIFLGLLTDDQEVANFYAACDVLALPSDTECFALVQVEAMRSGTPVVATNIPGAREVVKVTEMGEIVPPGDPQAFGEALLRVLSDRSKYVKPLEEIDAKFNLEETVNRYEKHLSDAARRAGSLSSGQS